MLQIQQPFRDNKMFSIQSKRYILKPNRCYLQALKQIPSFHPKLYKKGGYVKPKNKRKPKKDYGGKETKA